MMVVIGIIAILGAVVVPGFKKAYSDFKIMETLYFINTAMSAQRSFYLVFNERPAFDYGAGRTVDTRMLPFLPRGWVDTTRHRHFNGQAYGQSWEDFYYLASFVKAYQASSDLFLVGALGVYCNFPHFEDFLKIYEQKGYGLEKRSSVLVRFHGREKYNVYEEAASSNFIRWFR